MSLTGRPEASGSPGGALQCDATQDAIIVYCNGAARITMAWNTSWCPHAAGSWVRPRHRVDDRTHGVSEATEREQCQPARADRRHQLRNGPRARRSPAI